MTTAKRPHYSYEQYLRLLAETDLKLEYCDGIIYAMAGGTVAHAALGASAMYALRQALPASCTVFSSDLKVRIETSDLSTFPDASVVCGLPQRSPIDKDAITNPAILVEVTSASTEDYDRGDKLSHYKQIPGLRAVLFVSHRTPRVTVIARTVDGWDERDLRPGEVVQLETPALRFSVDDLYGNVTLETDTR